MATSKSDNLTYASNYFSEAFKIISDKELWTGNYQSRISQAFSDLKKYFTKINTQITALENAINTYNDLQTIALMLAQIEYNYNNTDSSSEQNNLRMGIQFNKGEYTKTKNKLNSYMNELTSLSVSYSTTYQSSDSGIFDLYSLLVETDVLDEINSNINKCCEYLSLAKSDVINQINSIEKKIPPMSNLKYYHCDNFDSNKAKTIKENINKLMNSIERLNNSISNYETKIENYENGKTVELYDSTNEKTQDYKTTDKDTLESLAKKYNVSEETLYDMNKELLDSTGGVIESGMVLSIPADDESSYDKISSTKINSDDYEIESLNGLTAYDDVKLTNWSVDCDQTDLTDLSSPLKKSLSVSCFPSPEVLDDDYKYSKYVDNGNYQVNVRPGKYHYGTDFKSSGDNVYSISSGVVVYSGNEYDCGTVVVLNEVENDDGSVSYYRTRYEHLTWDSVGTGGAVKAGEIVDENTKIGVSGSTGTSAAHLHVDVAKVDISEEEMAKCNSTEDIVKLYNSKTNNGTSSNQVTDMDSFVDLGSYYVENGKATNNANNSTTRK